MNKPLFRFDAPGAVQGWQAVDDRVMGGVSTSSLRHDAAGHAVFEGEVSLAFNGGFASVRSPAQDLGLAGARDCVIEARGDSRRYKLNLFTGDGLDATAYQAAFTPVAADWALVRLPLAAFSAMFRGRVLPGARPLEVARLRQVGLVIGDRQAGPFRLDLRCISLE